ncbi:hypothetical protein [Microcoleus sp.]
MTYGAFHTETYVESKKNDRIYEDPETMDLAVSNVSEWFNRHV